VWSEFLQLRASLHSRVMLARQCLTAASAESGDIASWLVYVAILLGAVLVCVCLGGHKLILSSGGRDNVSRASNISLGTRNRCRASGAIRSRHDAGEILSSHLKQLPHSRRDDCALPQAVFESKIPPMRLSTALTSSRSLPQLPQELSHSVLESSSCLGKADTPLCPELVVPPGQEILLRVPNNPMNSFHVVNFDGDRLFQVELTVGKTVPLEKRCVLLMTIDGNVLAKCVGTPVQGSGDGFHLLRANNEYFAKLVPEMPKCPSNVESWMAWAVRSAAGAEWLLIGEFGNRVVDVMDPAGRILAVSQQDSSGWTMDQHGDGGKTWLLRITSIDVAIVLCSLLAVMHLV